MESIIFKGIYILKRIYCNQKQQKNKWEKKIEHKYKTSKVLFRNKDKCFF